MQDLGFSTGTLARDDFRGALAMLQPHRLPAVELSALREAELRPLLEALDSLALSNYQHISVHAPSQLHELSEVQLCSVLQSVKARGWPIVVHPDIIADFEPWRGLGANLCLENMDKRKPIGRTARELEELFYHLPEARLCLDLGHSKQIDTSLYETRQILARHGSRLAQIHLSDVNSQCGHEPLNQLAMMSFQRIAHLLPENVPVILEGPVPADQIEAELRRARLVLQVLSPA